MVFSWFSTKAAVDFAEELARDFIKRIPSEILQTGTPQAESRFRGASDLMKSRAQVFAERNKLNLFSRARLVNTLKWRFRDAGYDDEKLAPIITEITRIVTLTKPATRK